MGQNEAYPVSFLATEHKFDALVKSLGHLQVGLSVINKEMRIVWVNQMMSNAFGGAEAIYGRQCYEVYNHRDKICPNCPTAKAFRTGKSGYSAVQRSFDKNGSRRYYRVVTTPITRNGRVTEVLEVVQEVTKDVISKRQTNKYRVQLRQLNHRLAGTNKNLSSKTRHLSKASEKIQGLNKELKNQIRNKSLELNIAVKELNTVYSVSREVISTLNIEEVFSLIAKTVCSIINTKACVLRMIDKDKKRLMLVSSHGVSQKYLENMPVRIGEGLSGIIAKTGEPVVCPQILKEDSIRDPYFINYDGYQSAIGVPIIFNDEVLGTILTYDNTVREYTKIDVMLLSTFASQVAVAIKNAQLHKKMHLTYLDTVNALVLAMEARDPYTHGHSERVTEYALELSKTVGLPKKQVDIIRTCGKLHDVGKIGVPDTILMKPAPLTEKEREIIQLHPSKGVEMLSPLKFLESGLPLIKHHHERFDGNGYPHGLKKPIFP